MATGLKLLGLLLCIAMATGDHHMMSSLEDLAEIQRDLYLRTFEFFNASVSTEMGKMIEKLKALEARLDDVEGRLEDYAARTGNDNEVPLPNELEPEPITTTTRKTTMMVEATSKMTTAARSTRMATVEVVDEARIVSGTTTAPTREATIAVTTEPRRPKITTRAPTTRRRTTTTLPPTTTTMPTTTTPPTTTPVPTTPMPTPVTCAELAQRGETRSGTYLIDPTRSGNTFYANCELPKGVTSIGHNATLEVHNNNHEDPASFRLNPVYDATIDQMKALTAASQNCSQFIKYRCRGAVLLAADKKSGLQYGYWVSVDGEQIVSWGGAPVNSGKCACALTVDGCLGSKPCNCDSNPKNFAVDEGLITDKPYLPVTDVYLGDTGSKKEEGYVTLGPLRCQ